MPLATFKRKRLPFKRVSKAKRTRRGVARRAPGRRAMRLMKYNVHMYKRYGTATLIAATQPTTSYNNVITFDLSQVRSPAELTTLYDQYKITGVKVMFKLVTNSDSNLGLNSTTASAAANFYPTLMWCRDYDNNTVEMPNDLRERNNTQMAVLKPNSMISVFVRPALRNQVYLDGVTTATSPVWDQWLDCSASNVPHYGLKYAIEMNGLTTVQDFYMRIEYVYYLKFKNAR